MHYAIDGRIAQTSASASPGGAQAVNYTYNSLAQRILKRDTRAGANVAQQTLYAEDGIGSTVLGQYSSQWSSTSTAPTGEPDSTEIIYLPTPSGPMPIAAQINGRLYAIDTDHLNTPRRLTNEQGQVAWQWLISGFGEVQPTTGAKGYEQVGTGTSYSEPVSFSLRYPPDQQRGFGVLTLHRVRRRPHRQSLFQPPAWSRAGFVSTQELSMKFQIEARKRTLQGSGASRRLRRQGRVPAIIYGGPRPPELIDIDHNQALLNHAKEAFHSSVLTLLVDGVAESVVLRDSQLHPWKPLIQHCDFQRVDAEHVIHQRIPLHFINAEIAPGVKLSGGNVSHVHNETH